MSCVLQECYLGGNYGANKKYLNCNRMLNEQAKTVYRSKYCKKAEYKDTREYLIVRFYVDFEGNGDIDMFKKIVYKRIEYKPVVETNPSDCYVTHSINYNDNKYKYDYGNYKYGFKEDYNETNYRRSLGMGMYGLK